MTNVDTGRLILFCLLFIIATLSLKGQGNHRIAGKVSSATGSLVGASVYLSAADSSGRVLTFDVTEEEGKFTLDVPTTDATVRFHASYLGYLPFDTLLDATNHSLSIALQRDRNILTELVFTDERASITIKEDTVTYDAATFRDSTDRRVADLLRKLPGVEVGDNGEIKVNGQSVRTVLVEGTDLFGAQYSVATENLAADVIETVEVIDNFQDNRVLRDLERTGDIVLNLKLREDAKNQLSGNATAGTGYGKEVKGNLYGTAFLIGRQLKHVFITSNGNTGEQYGLEEIEATYSYGGRDAFRDGIASRYELTNVIRPDYLNFRREFVDNSRSGFGTYRGHRRLGKQWEVHANVAVAGTAERQLIEERTRFAFDTLRYQIDQAQTLKTNNQFVDADARLRYVSVDQNRQFDAYLRYQYDDRDGDIQARLSQTNTPGERFTHAARLRRQRLRAGIRFGQRFNAHHALLTAVRIQRDRDEEQLLTNFSSLLNELAPTADASGLSQQLLPWLDAFDWSTDYHTRLGDWQLQAGVALQQERRIFDRKWTVPTVEIKERDTTANNQINSQSVTYALRAERAYGRTGRLRLYVRTAPERIRWADGQRIRFGLNETLNLGLFAEQELGKRLKGDVSYRFSQAPPVPQLNLRYLASPFELVSEQARPETTGGHRWGGRLRYLNPKKFLSAYLKVSLTAAERRWQYDYTFDNALNTRTPRFTTGGRSVSARGNVQYFLRRARMDVQVSPGYTRRNGPVLFDGMVSRGISERHSLRAQLSRKAGKRLTLQFDGSIARQQFTLKDQAAGTFVLQRYAPAVILDWGGFRWFANAYYAGGTGADNSFNFWGSKFRIARTLTLGKWTTNATLDINNLLGVQRYTQLRNSPDFFYRTTVDAIPRFAVLSVDVRF